MNAFKKIEENPIILDLSVCKNWIDLHIMLKQKFGFPEYYGNNWSAFWDCIDGLFDGEPECGGEYDIRIVRMIAAKLSKLRLYEQAQQKGFKYN